MFSLYAAVSGSGMAPLMLVGSKPTPELVRDQEKPMSDISLSPATGAPIFAIFAAYVVALRKI